MFTRSLAALAALFCLFASTAHAQKLDYRQQQALKDAKFYLDRVEGTLDDIEAKLKTWKVGDASVPITDVRAAKDAHAQSVQYMKNAGNRLPDLPGDNADVGKEIDRYNAFVQRMNDANKKLNEVEQALANVVNQGAGAGFEADFKRLREINEMFADEQLLERRPEVGIEVAKQIPNVKAERARIAEKYADLLKQPTAEARDMNGVLRYFDEVFGRFDARAKMIAQQSPRKIEMQLADVVKAAKDAAANQRPAWFGPEGGIAQRLRETQTSVDVYAALEPEAAKSYQAKLDDARKEVATIGKTLETDIIKNNQVPAEQFSGADKAELIQIIADYWKKEGNGVEPMKVGMNSQGWQRSTRWEWMSSAWYKVDKSKTQGFVVVKHDDTTAAVYYVWLSKDHLSEDRITPYFLDSPKDEVSVIRKVLLTNVK